jgi:hypothetical protein
MADSEPAVLVDTSLQASKLRIELKAWENTFAAANNGRKAGREDIKQHPEIGWCADESQLSITAG